MDRKWITANIVYAGNLDKLIHSCLIPLTREVLALPSITRFFWVRNQDNGQHIRLRFFGTSDVLREQAAPIIRERTSGFFLAHPGKKGGQNDWHTDQVLFTPYHPEIERYGGAQCLRIVEQHFTDSSQLVMQLIGSGHPLTLEQRLCHSIALQLRLIHPIAPSVSDMIHFLQHEYAVRWIKIPELVYEEIGKSALLPVRRKEVVAHFEQRPFYYQGFVLREYQSIRDRTADATWKSQWQQCMQETIAQIQSLHEEGNVRLRKSWHTHRHVLWPICESMCHMTHNRMGTRNLFEGYLARIMADALGTLTN
ncbi:MAG: thiopeptide-type bacteriocin biosynthesis protein [Saprospiraceae bacterium]|nr:thiopeptide-type bacteriocin biosynthesis protein [Saprospiraceae bacterium]